MRVCIIYDCLYPYTVGGAERWYGNLAKRLARDGHEVTYLTLRQWDRGSHGELEGVRVLSAGPRMALYTGDRRRIAPPLLFGAGVLWHLLRHGRSYDVVHCASFPYFSLLAAGAARARGHYELVVDWVEVWSHSYWRDYLGGLGGAIGYAIQRACVRVPQRAFCLSELHARRLRAEGLRGDVTVLRGLYGGPAPDTEAHGEQEAPNAGPADPLVVFAGRMIPEKRAPLGVAGVVAAHARIPNLRAVFFGDGPEHALVLAEIAKHGAQDWITAPGFGAQEDVQAHLRSATCLLLPSVREGYGLIVVEASACATPSIVVAAEDNAATELVEEGVNGVIAANADADSIADAIVQIQRAGPAMRASTAQWFAAHAQELSIESSLSTVLASYQRSPA